MKAAKAKPSDPAKTLEIPTDGKKSHSRVLAEVALDPAASILSAVQAFNHGSAGAQSVTDIYNLLLEQGKAVNGGDLSHQRAMLVAQATTLNAIFAEMARRASSNMGEYLNAMQIYMRLAFKAQAQSRATIEALDRLTNGHVQTVKHVHVNEGGQAVIADQFHHHTGGQEIGQIGKQSHATGPGAAGPGPALPSPDPFGGTVPLPRREGQETVQDARRD